MNEKQPFFTAEISIIPITTSGNTSMSKEIALVYNAINHIQGLKISHTTLRNIGIERIISSIRIDERPDKSNTLDGKINSVKLKS
jgi:uncharacterized protein YqgV (UPF0045/DUF77 family)